MTVSNSMSPSPAKWVERFARIGLFAKGFVYCITGILAFMAAFKIGGATEKDAGQKGLFKVVAEQPLGILCIALIAIGLALFCAWRFIQAVKDTEHKGSDLKGLGKRAAYFLSGLGYTGIVIYAVKFLMDVQRDDKGNSQQKAAQEILQKPAGEWLLYLLAAIIAGIGIYQVFYAISGKYKKHVERSKLEARNRDLMLKTGKVGYMARGIVWLIIAWLFCKAAMNHNANEAGGTDSAFRWLNTFSYGPYLMGAVAIGLICYGIFMFVRGRYQPISY